MIARVWQGSTKESQSYAYAEYLKRTGVKDCRATPGNRGVLVFKRMDSGRAEFVFISLWDSLEVIGAFAGADIQRAVYYPEDPDYLLSMSPEVVHYEVSAIHDAVALC